VRVEHWRYAIPLWLRGLLRRRDVERDLDDEIRDHIDHQTAAYLAEGMHPDQARRAALVRFGGVERIKDESRDARRLSIIDSIAQLRFAARSLARARTFTVAMTATIALAVGAGCAAFALVDTVLLRPLPYPDSDRLVGLWHAFPGIGMPIVRQAPGTYASYRTSARLFESIGAFGVGQATIASGAAAEPERLPGAGVAPSIFSMLRARPLLGRVPVDADEQEGAPPVVVINEAYWRTRLAATPNVLGRTIRVNDIEREIVGVMPASFAFPGSDVRVWMPANVRPGPYLGSFNFRAIGRLRPGVSVAAAQAELQQILSRIGETFPEQQPGVPTPRILQQTQAVAVVHRLRDDVIGGFTRILTLVAGTVGLLVLVAFSNVASLTLARVEARRRELAIRATLGASASRIWWSLLGEAAMVSCVGGLVGFGVAASVLALLAHAGPTRLPDPMVTNGGDVLLPRLNEIGADWSLGLFALALTALFCIVSGSIGTWRVMRTDTSRALREDGRSATASKTSQRLRSAFVVAEVALSLALLSGSAVLGRSLLRLRAIHPGFTAANAFTFWTFLPPARYRESAKISRFYQDAIARIGRLPRVESVGTVSKLPLAGYAGAMIMWAENSALPDGPMPPSITYVTASSGYFRAMQIPIVAGRTFDDDAVRRGANEVVVTRGFVLRHWNDSTGQRSVGRRMLPRREGPWYTIVGVAEEVRDTALTAPPLTMAYFPADAGTDPANEWRTSSEMAFVVRTNSPSPGLSAAVEREIHSLDPALPVYETAFLTDIVSKAGSRMRFALLLLGTGAAVTLALGIVGLYGVIAYVVGLRSREIGIRIALGLRPDFATRMIVRQGEAIIIAGALLGVGVFLAFAKLLRSLVFEVGVLDTMSVAVAGLAVLLIATLATWVPARRAARIDPAAVLKGE
jgi:putative ABC transport system permease protein